MGVSLVVAAMASVLVAAGPTAPAAPSTPASPTTREALERGRTAFVRAEYQRAIEILRPLLYPEQLLDSEGEIVQVHRMLGVAYLFENKPEEARREFEKLLDLRQDYRFDPLLDPQRVVDFFNDVVKERKAFIDAANERRRRREKEAAEKRAREAARLQMPPTSSATNGIRSWSTSSRSAPASSRTGTAARGGSSWARRRCWARCRWARSRPTWGSTA